MRDAGAHDAGAGGQQRKAVERDGLAEQVEAEAAGKGDADEDHRGRGTGGVQQRDSRRAVERDRDHRHDEGRAVERARCPGRSRDRQTTRRR